MEKLDAMRAFTKVVALSSFTEAAHVLGLTRSAVSKSVAELEEILGVRLIDRTTRQVSVTETGRAYYERCLDILASIEETELEVSQLHAEPRGVLRVNAPMSFGVMHLARAITEFMARHPNLKIELLLNDQFIDPIQSSIDITIRVAILTDSSLVARKLAPAPRALVASPKYLAQYGTPDKPEDLIHHRCLHYSQHAAPPRWDFTHAGNVLTVPISSAFCSNNGDIIMAAAIADQGIANLPSFLVSPEIGDGRLVTVLPNFPPTQLNIYALYAPHKYMPAKIRALIDHLVAHFGDAKWDQVKGVIHQ